MPGLQAAKLVVVPSSSLLSKQAILTCVLAAGLHRNVPSLFAVSRPG